MFFCCALFDQIDLVLQDDDILQLHNLDCSQMFRCLWLRAAFVSGHKKQSGIHDCCTVQHGSHQNVVTGTIDKRYVSMCALDITTTKR